MGRCACHRMLKGAAPSGEVALLALCGLALALGPGAGALRAQEWRGRVFTRVQYLEARPVARDSVAIGLTTGVGRQRLYGDTLVSCATGATHCFFYRPLPVRSTTPATQDLDLSVWGFGVPGLRLYLSARLRTALGDDDFWPRSEDHFDLFAGYIEYDPGRYRLRVGRDYQVSGLGFYGYDGGSAEARLFGNRLELEAYGGWGLERGLPEPVTSDALASLEEFQPLDRNFLFGFRASARPAAGASFEVIYQREIETDRSGLASERIGLEGAYFSRERWWLQAHADYDLATGWWGKAGLTLGAAPQTWLSLEGRLFRYRPVFSLQTVWAAFSPTPYTGWGLSLGIRPRPNLQVSLEGERRDYGDTDADVPFQVTTDRTWRAGADLRWHPIPLLDLAGGYWLDFTFGSALSAGQGRIRLRPSERLTLAVRGSVFQQLGEFRVGEGRVWSIGSEVRWRTGLATLWASVDRYRHDRRDGGVGALDWTQTRAAAGLAFYLGSEPGSVR